MLKKVIVALALLITFSFLYSQTITLVDFGDSESNNSFGLDGWNTILKSSNLIYSDIGDDGLVVNSADSAEFSDYRGISGTDYSFSLGDRIAVTWYNNSSETIVFTSRISFTDLNEPNIEDNNNKWFTMRSFDDYRRTFTEIQPNSSAITVFNITNKGVHKSDSIYSSININLAIEWGSTYEKQYLVCEKIELMKDADISPPSQPQNLSSWPYDSKIELFWDKPSDDNEVVEYLIYSGDKIEGYSRSESHTCFHLESNTEYTFSISALDAVGNESQLSQPITVSTFPYSGNNFIFNPKGLVYAGAFAVPETFAWGGEALAFNIHGDGGCLCTVDEYPGSLFITNLNQPVNGLVGEISVPRPAIASDMKDLGVAALVTEPTNIRPESINNWDYVDIWRTGLEYHRGEQRLYSSWSIHYTVGGDKHSSISCCNASDLANSEKQGAWFVGDANEQPIDAGINDWLFSVPKNWANENVNGRNMMVGRCRDGGLSGLGPTIYAFSDFGESVPVAESELDITTLLEYGTVLGTNNYNYPNSMNGYKHSDDWREALWINGYGQQSIAIVGHKALGDNWYGYHGHNLHHEWVMADIPYPEMYTTDPDGKGWRGHTMEPMIIFYDPADLAQVAAGNMESYEPQPYAAYRIDKDIFFGENHEIFSAAVDTMNHLLFITEFVRERDGNLVIHMFETNYIETSIDKDAKTSAKFQLKQNYPNPFNPTTTIEFSIENDNFINLEVYDINGNKIKSLINKRLNKGFHKMTFEGHSLSSGLYFYKLTVNNSIQTKKCLLIK
jgi:hypothetical protein